MLALDPNCLVGVQVNAMRRQLAIRVSGFDAPGPVESFEQCGLDVSMLAVIKGMK
jgi:ATP-dependent RNA helicase DDX42